MKHHHSIAPPSDFAAYSPSELFRFFFQIGRWTEESFSEIFQNYTHGRAVSTVTISNWKNKDAIPTRYSSALFKLIKDVFDTDIADYWITAFETVWAHHAARNKSQTSSSIKKLTGTDFASLIRQQHIKWIISKYEEHIIGENFSLADIYVPLQFVEITSDAYILHKPDDLVPLTLSEFKNKTEPTWTFINGESGSGKSAAAIHMARNLESLDVFPVFLRSNQLSQIEIDITADTQLVNDSFSLNSYLKNFRASSYSSACLFLDNADKIEASIFSELRAEQIVCASQGKTLHIFLFGRKLEDLLHSTLHADTKIRLLNTLSLDGTLHENSSKSEEVIGEDFRPHWWETYLAANNLPACTELPDFLSQNQHDLSELGSHPQLAYLICRSAFTADISCSMAIPPNEQVDLFTYEQSENAIYRNIISQIIQREKQHTPSLSNIRTRQDSYLEVLKYIALKNWHSGGVKTAPLASIKPFMRQQDLGIVLDNLLRIESEQIAFKIVQPIAHLSPEITQTAITLERTRVALPNKAISDYLVCTLIFDKFKDLISSYGSETAYLDAHGMWIQITRAGKFSTALIRMLQNEANFRYSGFKNLDWDLALELIVKIDLFSHSFNKTDLGDSVSIQQLKQSARVLFYVWSCLNQERFKRSNSPYTLFRESSELRPNHIRQIQTFSSTNYNPLRTSDRVSLNSTLLSNSLSCTHIKSSDMGMMSFVSGKINNIFSESTSFAMTSWQSVKVSFSQFEYNSFQKTAFLGCQFDKTTFEHVLFQGASLENSKFSESNFRNTLFSQSHFSDVDFVSTNFENVIFDRCVFVGCYFDTIPTKKPSRTFLFRHCTFVNMDNRKDKLPSNVLEKCYFQKDPVFPEETQVEMKNIFTYVSSETVKTI